MIARKMDSSPGRRPTICVDLSRNPLINQGVNDILQGVSWGFVLEPSDLVLLLGALLTGFSFLVLLKWCVPEASPFKLVWRFAREHAMSRQSLFYLLTLLGIMFLDIAEIRYDERHHPAPRVGFHHSLPPDRRLGHGTFPGRPRPLDDLRHGRGLPVYFPRPRVRRGSWRPTTGGRSDLARKLFWGTIFNYVLILPFYILVPVSERWAAGDGEVSFLMNQISPSSHRGPASAERAQQLLPLVPLLPGPHFRPPALAERQPAPPQDHVRHDGPGGGLHPLLGLPLGARCVRRRGLRRGVHPSGHLGRGELQAGIGVLHGPDDPRARSSSPSPWEPGTRQVAENLARELEPLGPRLRTQPLEKWVPWEYDLLFRHGYLFLALDVPRVWDAMYHSAGSPGAGARLPVMNGQHFALSSAKAWAERTWWWPRSTTPWRSRRIGSAAHRADLKLAVVITDYDIYPLWARPEVDLYLVPHGLKPRRLRALGVVTERIVVTGIPIARAFEDPVDWGATRAALALAPEAPTAMVFGGGGGMGPLKEFAQVAIERSTWQVVLVCGQNERLRKSLIPLAQAAPGSAPRLGVPQGHPGPHAGLRCGGDEGGCAQLDRSPLFGSTRLVIMPGLPGQEQVNMRFMEAKGWVDSCRRCEDLPAILENGCRGEGACQGRHCPVSPRAEQRSVLDELARRGT